MKFESGNLSVDGLKNASPLALSFVGDAVHTLMVRAESFEIDPYSNGDLHVLSSMKCRASAQARIAQKILPLLTEEERFIFKKGKNAKVNSVPKHADLYEYNEATALEALIGFLFLSGRIDRLNELMKAVYGEENA